MLGAQTYLSNNNTKSLLQAKLAVFDPKIFAWLAPWSTGVKEAGGAKHF